MYTGLYGIRKYKGERKNRSNKKTKEGAHAAVQSPTKDREEHSALNKLFWETSEKKREPKKGLLSDMAYPVSLFLRAWG